MSRQANPVIRRVVHVAEFEAARRLFLEYQDAIGVDLCFQDFAAELEDLRGRYGTADSGLWLAWHGALPVGCAALRPEGGSPGDRAGELKRFYVRPEWQGFGVGRRLLDIVIEAARTAGYARLRLDTLLRFETANRLYEAAGFTEIENYNGNTLAGTRFMELPLAETRRQSTDAAAGKPRIEAPGAAH